MKTLFLVQSNTGYGHINRVKSFCDHINENLIITKPVLGHDTEFFDKWHNDLFVKYVEYNPDVIVTEGFPFGRYGWHSHFNKNLRRHKGIMDILDHAKNKKIYSLERDIPWIRPSENWFHSDILNEYYDGIIFHTDNNFIDPKEFLHNQIIDVPIISSSYVTKPFQYNTHRNGYLVSGGDWYPHIEKYYNVALDVRKRIGGDWTFIVGDKTPNKLLDRLQKENVNIVSRPDTNGYRDLLESHELSISQFGAMSFLDINITKTPAIMIPNDLTSNDVYDSNGVVIDKEENYRAKRYEQLGGGKVISIDDVTVDSLTDSIYKVVHCKPTTFDMNGAKFVKEFFNGTNTVH